ncbi:dynamin family protein [Undibacterium seohonense]|uniref:Dynamin family protein n=1 Tax=Undibacterium seohonense TaxID=1344950 RepID=A0ABR6X0B4_9BURK|nr:dynamin family protein [Undibacterium seohonense]MBC3805801.1 dynamin family protein [Undibacterium seohonense]
MQVKDQLIQQLKQVQVIQTQFGDLIGNDFKSAIDDSKVHSIGDIENHLKILKEENRTLQIGIIGRVKAGKSSLLNALFFDGKDVLPHAATPMTAALTTLSYGDRPAMRVEFFSKIDLLAFERLFKDHEEAISKGIEEKKQHRQQAALRVTAPTSNIAASRKSPSVAVRAIPEKTDNEWYDIVKKELQSKNPSTASAHELWCNVVEAGGIEKRPKDLRIEKNSIAELSRSLGDYVGAKGRHTPYTKCLHLELPFESLKDICVVDTPGLNDPILSREKRTQDMLKECDAVFVISPAGQFLTTQDLELLERLASREGVREIFVIASQIDGQLFGAELQDCAGEILEAISRQKKSLIKQAQKVFDSEAVQRLQIGDLSEQLEQRMLTTSSVAYAMQTLPPAKWNDTIKHADEMLQKKYPLGFANPEQRKQTLEALSGLPSVVQSLHHVRHHKTNIFACRESDYLDGQLQASEALVSALKVRAEKHQSIFINSDLGEVNARLKEINSVRKVGIASAVTVYDQLLQDLRINLPIELKKLINTSFEKASSKAESAKGSELRTRNVSGMWSWMKRVVGTGGTEDYSVMIIDAASVRREFENFSAILETSLIELVGKTGIKWRNDANKDILAALREAIDSTYIDVNEIKRNLRNVVNDMLSVPVPELPSIPDNMYATGKLESSQAVAFGEAAKEYLDNLKKLSGTYVEKFEKQLKESEKKSIGEALFDDLLQEAEELRKQLKDCQATKQRYDKLLSLLEEMAA